MTCIFCMQPTFEVKFDVKGRPYYKCASCRQKIFISSVVSLRAVEGLSRIMSNWNKEELAEYFTQSNEFFKQLYNREGGVRRYVDNVAMPMDCLRAVQNA